MKQIGFISIFAFIGCLPGCSTAPSILPATPILSTSEYTSVYFYRGPGVRGVLGSSRITVDGKNLPQTLSNKSYTQVFLKPGLHTVDVSVYNVVNYQKTSTMKIVVPQDKVAFFRLEYGFTANCLPGNTSYVNDTLVDLPCGTFYPVSEATAYRDLQ